MIARLILIGSASPSARSRRWPTPSSRRPRASPCSTIAIRRLEATVKVGGAVKFAYAAGDEAHNVHFEHGGPAVHPAHRRRRRAGRTRSLPAISEGPGWSGECTFSQAGVYHFFCDDHRRHDGQDHGRQRRLARRPTRPTPTPTADPDRDPAPSGGGASRPRRQRRRRRSAPRRPRRSSTLAATQRGQAVARLVDGRLRRAARSRSRRWPSGPTSRPRARPSWCASARSRRPWPRAPR